MVTNITLLVKGGEWVLLPQRLVQDPADDGGEEEEGAGLQWSDFGDDDDGDDDGGEEEEGSDFDKGDDDHDVDDDVHCSWRWVW